MKVYFEETGTFSYAGKVHKDIEIYVYPQEDRSAFVFDGEDYLTREKRDVHPEKARVFESDELPTRLWEAIQGGAHAFYEVDAKLDEWTPKDIIYKNTLQEQSHYDSEENSVLVYMPKWVRDIVLKTLKQTLEELTVKANPKMGYDLQRINEINASIDSFELA